MQDHEYSIIGHSRASIGRYLGGIAAAIASLVTASTAALLKIIVAHDLPLWTHALVVIPITAGLAYAVVHGLFNKFGWRFLAFLSHLPHINGIWKCEGKTINGEGDVVFQWTARVVISQNWEKIRVRLETETSASNSVSAALIPEPDGCWNLMYSYRNEPRIGEAELQSHVGYCELRFAKDQLHAVGDYFNAKGRGTFGRMELTKDT